MVPFSAFATAHWSYGSPRLERYNGLPVRGDPRSAGAGKEFRRCHEGHGGDGRPTPAGIGFEWTGLSYQERMSGSQAPALYAISLLVVFLCLAALYESWAIPFSVMLVMPLGVIGAVLAATSRGFANDVYFQIGLS